MTVDIITTPGFLTDQEVDRARADWLRAHGYDWIAFQVVNPKETSMTKTRNLAPARDAGLAAGVWGVTYGDSDKPNAAIFHRDGVALGEMALQLGAAFVIVDAEFCACFTRDSRGLEPIVKGLRDAGWTGPVHLCPLGAPANGLPHGPNDFAYDLVSFLETGGGVLPQAYFNAFDVYRPSLCVDYWRACGVPASRLNVMVEVFAENGRPRLAGKDWLPLLKEAGVRRNFSIYMQEGLQPFDLEGLDELSQAPQPAPEPEPEVPPVTTTNDAAARNAQVAEITQGWLDNFGPAPLSRMACEHDIAAANDETWNAVRQYVRGSLNGDVQRQIAQLQADLKAANALVDRTKAALADANAKIANAKAALA